MAFRHALLATAFLVTLLRAQEPEQLGESTDAVDQDMFSQELQAPEEPEEAIIDEGDPKMLSHEQLAKAHSLVDANKDGKISVQELMDFSHKTRQLYSSTDLTVAFGEMDRNKDGKLSFEEKQEGPESGDDQIEAEGSYKLGDNEFRTHHESEKAKFQAADLDKDGLLSKEEAIGLFYPARNEKVLRLMVEQTIQNQDMDKDGSLTASEFWQIDPSQQASAEQLQEFKSLDTSGDGKLNLQELMPWESGLHQTKKSMDQLVANADKNSDGHLTTDELMGARDSIGDTHAGYDFLEWAAHGEL